MGKRIGFLLANVYQGSSLSMWKSIAAARENEKDSALFVFPGGRINYLDGDEYLRNSIYELANSASLDGAIVWSSALTGRIGPEEVSAFVKNIAEDIPIVSLGMSIEGCPSVNFDAKGGMLQAIEHMINIHGEKKIAFLRGPDNHKSAEDRLEAYKEALERNGIAYDQMLVSSPHPWSGGVEAMKELVEKRGLVPGRDFTSIVAASDLLLRTSNGYLQSIGISIPKDLKAVGFNDNPENILLDYALTTVRMPIESLAKSSYVLISSIIEGKAAPDMLLPTHLIVRHSCGCSGFSSIGDQEEEALWRRVGARFESDKAVKSAKEMVRYLDGEVGEDVLAASSEDFVSVGGDSEALFEIISTLRKGLAGERKDRLYGRILIGERKASALARQRTDILTGALDQFKTNLLAARSLSAIPEIMQSAFRIIGIDKCFLMRYDDFSSTSFIGGFSSSKLFNQTEAFDRKQIAPDSIKNEIANGTFVIEPLFYGIQELGYIIIGTDWCEGYVLEDIRTSLSSAMRGISFLEQATEAKEAAEKGERDAEEFYAKVSESLMQPISEIHNATLSRTRLSKDELLHQISRMEHLLELALAERGALSIERTFSPLSSLLPLLYENGLKVNAPKALPLIEFDKERILEAIIILSSSLDEEDKTIDISFSEQGVVFAIADSRIYEETSFQLAERIVVMHSGSINRKNNKLYIRLPYPKLSEGKQEGSGIVYVSEEGNLPKELDAKEITLEELPDCNARAVALDLSSRHVASALLSEKTLRSVSVILFSDNEDISLRSALESVASAGEKIIGVFGDYSSLPPVLHDVGKIEIIESLENIEEMPSVMLMTKIDPESLSLLRHKPIISSIPVVIVMDKFSEKDSESISQIPNVIIVNTAMLESNEFLTRLSEIAGGGAMLPPLTGMIVKRAIVYLNSYATKQISRWQLAAAVNISEDYLTRIFRKELGLSPWEYLNRYRIQLACALLMSTASSLSSIASECGFQDQAYFCRVFKKIKGFPPGHMRRQ